MGDAPNLAACLLLSGLNILSLGGHGLPRAPHTSIPLTTTWPLRPQGPLPVWVPLPGTLFSFSLPLALALTVPWLSSSGTGAPPWAPSPLWASLRDEPTKGRDLLPRCQLHPRTGPWPSAWAGAGPTFFHLPPCLFLPW